MKEKKKKKFYFFRILALIPLNQYKNPAGYVTDVTFFLTIWYQIIEKNKLIVQRVLEWKSSFTNEETYRGISRKFLACQEQEICQFSLQVGSCFQSNLR